MSQFHVPDMTCGHCVKAITSAIAEQDPEARVSIDLPAHTVQVEGGRLDQAALLALLSEAGYTPTPAA